MKYYIYVLKSEKNDKRYVGSTSKNPNERLIDHNYGSNKWTRENKPFILIYYEEFTCKKCAQQREKFLKSGKGRELLDIIEKYFARR